MVYGSNNESVPLITTLSFSFTKKVELVTVERLMGLLKRTYVSGFRYVSVGGWVGMRVIMVGGHGRAENQRNRAVSRNGRSAAAGTHGNHAGAGGRGQSIGGERTAEIRQLIAYQVGHAAGGHNVDQCAGRQGGRQRDSKGI